jgi:hypothetical protein
MSVVHNRAIQCCNSVPERVGVLIAFVIQAMIVVPIIAIITRACLCADTMERRVTLRLIAVITLV